MIKNSILILVSFTFLLSCETEEIIKKDVTDKHYTQEEWKQRALNDAQFIVENKNSIENVWNFNAVAEEDSVRFYYANLFKEIENEKIITVFGYTACSFGCSGNLILVYDSLSMKLEYAKQIPVVFEFVDVEGDGIDEIFTDNFVMWMGYCTQYLSLYNLESEKQFFNRSNESPDFCGDDKMNYPNPPDYPDTTHKHSSYSFRRDAGRLQLILYSEYSIHNGVSDTIQEIIKL